MLSTGELLLVTFISRLGVTISRGLDQSGVFQACYIVKIYHSGLELSISAHFALSKTGFVHCAIDGIFLVDFTLIVTTFWLTVH